MKTFVIFLALALATAAANEEKISLTTSRVNGIRKTHRSGELIFEDNFDSIDFDKWDHEITMAGGGNWEFQVYWNNRSNSYIRDSILYLKPTLTEDRFGEEFVRTGHLDLWGGQPGDLCTMEAFFGCDRTADGTNIINPTASARLRTANHFSFTYGRVEARAKTPSGDWIWPAIWMLPLRQEYGIWPTSGEIDIMESRGNVDLVDEGVQIGNQQYGATLHYGIDYVMNGWSKAHFDKQNSAGWSNDFHVYGVEWTPEYIKFEVDGEELGTVTVPEGGFYELGEFETDYPGTGNPWEGQANNAPFDKEFYLIMNVAVGGIGYFPDTAAGGTGKPWNNESPHASLDFYNAKGAWYPTWNSEVNNGEDAAMQVDYVRVWAL